MKQSILIIALIIIFNLPKFAFAQRDSSATGINIKVNPFQWYYDDIRVFAEYPLSKNNSLQLRLGYRDYRINPYDQKYNDRDQIYRDPVTDQYDTALYSAVGFSLGLAYNHYYRNNWYIQPSFLFRHTSFSFGWDDNWNNWVLQWLTYDTTSEGADISDFIKNIYALEFRYGKVFIFNRFILDLFTGAGVRLRYGRIIPGTGYGITHDQVFYHSTEYEVTPTLHLGLNIGWIIKK